MRGKGKFTKNVQAKGKFQAKGWRRNNASHTNKKSVNDYNYYLRLAKQASDYETTTEYLINYINKVFNYGNEIGTVLELLEPMSTSAAWKPRIHLSAKNRQYEIEFKADYDAYSKRVQTFENNNTKE